MTGRGAVRGLLPTYPGGGRGVADLPRPEHEPDEVRELAEEILSRPEYQEPEPSWPDRAWDAVIDFLDGLFGGGGTVGGGSAGSLAWVLLVLLVGAVVGYLAWAFATGRLGRGGRRTADRPAVLTETEEDVPSEVWEARAEAHEAAGRWREGIVCRYRALVVSLGDRGVLSTVAGRTAGDHAREMAERRPAASVSFEPATEMFEDVWYGGAAAGPDERDRFVRLAAATRDATLEPGAPADGPVVVASGAETER